MRDVEYFIPARETDPEIPLQRYLAPLAADVLRQHLGRCTSPGDLILDPTAQTPHLPLAAARLGRKAISSNFNPISTLLVRGILSLPAPDELDAATMQLGDSLKRGIPLRDHINGLYASSCERCSRPVIVEHFLWDGEESSPVSKRYQCPHCGNEGQFPVVHGDLQALEAVESQGVHYWYLLERLAQPHEPERMLAEELLQLYTSRNLYALTDLSMRIEGLFSHSPSQTALQLILLSCLDKCSKLAAAPMPRATASRLEPPSTFMERNVWHAFEEAYLHVRELVPADPVSLASEVGEVLEQDLQALVLNEPVRKVAALLPPASVSLIIGAPQAYYRPFWTLSYLWSGWLWGRHKATLLKPLLRRKTMGW
jgi:DNA-directed RNA polymerase subunit RPC12/RpoP